MADQVRERIRGLLVKVGDERKKVAGNIKGLVAVLQDDIADHRDTIMISLIECAKFLPTKAGIYGTWLAMMNPHNRVFVAETINGLYGELRYAVCEGNLNVATCLVRTLIECANSGCLSVSSLVTLLGCMIDATTKGGFRQSEVGIYMLLSSIPWFSPALALNDADVSNLIQRALAAASELVSSIDYRRRRDLVSFMAGFPDRLESAITAVEAMRATGWDSLVLIRPYAMEGITLATPSAEFIHTVPSDDDGLFEALTAPKRRFVPQTLISTATASGDDQPLTISDVFLLQEMMDNTVTLFQQSVGECAKSLLRIPVLHSQFEPVLVDVVVSRALSPSELVGIPPAFYYSLLHRCVVLQESVRPHLEAALMLLSQQSLSEESQFALAEMISFLFVNNMKFDRIAELSKSAISKFLMCAIRLTFVNSLQAKLPEQLRGMIPAEPGTGNPFEPSDAYQQVKEVVRIKDGSEFEVVQVIEPMGVEGYMYFVRAFVENGSRTVTHFTRLMELYRNILINRAPSAETRERVILESVFTYWTTSNEFRLEKILEILLKEKAVSAIGIARNMQFEDSQLASYRLATMVTDFAIRQRESLDESTDTQLREVAAEIISRSSEAFSQWFVKKYFRVLSGDVHELLSLF